MMRCPDCRSPDIHVITRDVPCFPEQHMIRQNLYQCKECRHVWAGDPNREQARADLMASTPTRAQLGPDEAFGIFCREMRVKFDRRASKPGNTNTPWHDFDRDHLRARLREEIDEYFDSGNRGELVDIANLCLMVYLCSNYVPENIRKEVEKEEREG